MELKINNYEDRKNLIVALINSGYTVRVIEKDRTDSVILKDFIVKITDV